MAVERSALLIGADRFGDPVLEDLNSPATDVMAMRDVLADPARGDYRVAEPLVNEPSHFVSRAIERFFMAADGGELRLLYVSCHGVTGHGQELYFAMPDTELGALMSTGVNSGFVKKAMRHSPARGIVVILDCCHSGGFKFGAKGDDTSAHVDELHDEGRGHVVFTASNEIEVAIDGQGAHELGRTKHSAFTQAIVDGIRSGKADKDRRGTIDEVELRDWINQHVRATTQHHAPEMWGTLPSGLYIAKSTASPISDDLLDLIEDRSPERRRIAAIRLGAQVYEGDSRAQDAAREALLRLKSDRSSRVSDAAREALGEPLRRSRSASQPSREPAAVTGLIQRAERNRHSRRYEDALSVYDKALERSPDSLTALVGRGEALVRLHRFEDAIESLDRAVDIDHEHVTARITRAQALSASGRREDALADLAEALSADPSSTEALTARGETSLRNDDPDYASALGDFDRALETDPRSVDALVGRVLASIGLERWADARKALDAAREADPLAPEAAIASARLNRARRKPSKAIQELDRALELDPRSMDALILRGRCKLDMNGRLKGAVEDFERARSASPHLPGAHFGRALCHVDQGENEEALAALDTVVGLRRLPGTWPTPQLALSVRGEVLLRLGKPTEAVNSFDDALSHDPDFARALGGRGRANVARGRPELAIRDLGRAMTGDVEDVEGLADARAEALASLPLRPSTEWPEDLAEELDNVLAMNRAVLDEAELDGGWLGERRHAMANHISGTEQLLWLGRCGRPQDVQRHVALLVTTEQLVWCRQTYGSSARAEQTRWSEVTRVQDFGPDGFRLVLRNGRRVDFVRVSDTGVDLTRGRLDLRSGDVRDLIRSFATA
jgi:tetratricopeptide (TPR) repeat protein